MEHMFSEGGDKLCRIPLCSCIKEGNADSNKLPENLLRELWSPIVQQFNQLAAEPIHGYRFFLLFCKGDLQVRCDTWGFPSYNSADQVCSGCSANRTSRPWTDLRAGAAWRPTTCGVTSAEASNYFARSRFHPLWESDFKWRFFAPIDQMHIMDCNGVANIAVSSVIAPLTYDARLGPNRQARLDVINGLLAEYYTTSKADVNSRMPPLRLQNLFNNQGWHMLCGPPVKAASTRHLLNFLLVLVDKYYNDDNVEENRLVGRAVRTLSRMYSIVYKSGFALSPDEGDDLRRLVLRLDATVQQLRELKRLATVQWWQITYKTITCST